MTMNRLGSTSVLVLSMFLLSACSGFGAKAYVGIFQGDLEGDIALDTSAGGIPLGSIQADIQDDLGVRDSDESIYLRAEAYAAFARVTVSAFQYESSGDGTLAVTFGDITAGADVHTDIEFKNLKVALTFDLINIGPLRISPGVAIDIFDINTTVSSVSPIVISENVDVLAPVPMVYLQGELDLGYVAANLDVGYMSIDLQDADGTFLDIEAMLRANPWDHVEFFAGYRYILMEASGEASGQDFDADLVFQGWFAGGGITF